MVSLDRSVVGLELLTFVPNTDRLDSLQTSEVRHQAGQCDDWYIGRLDASDHSRSSFSVAKASGRREPGVMTSADHTRRCFGIISSCQFGFGAIWAICGVRDCPMLYFGLEWPTCFPLLDLPLVCSGKRDCLHHSAAIASCALLPEQPWRQEFVQSTGIEVTLTLPGSARATKRLALLQPLFCQTLCPPTPAQTPSFYWLPGQQISQGLIGKTGSWPGEGSKSEEGCMLVSGAMLAHPGSSSLKHTVAGIPCHHGITQTYHNQQTDMSSLWPLLAVRLNSLLYVSRVSRLPVNQ
ncbi:unnamed protein product [Protopolystoma xenopodis]|uniref:Uncharacterized protein n=1 Tax=Protopolystoma xenopodis TaxID=117903 RepID=A0A448WFF2_9PLAT|nr:unnamed protein product [Protopolystoma xenopodis]